MTAFRRAGDAVGRRLLLVHAHPDDETIGTGATIAHYAAAGARVTLVTCTLGEEGEILLPDLAGLAAGHGDQLGGYRTGELAAALRALGVDDHRFLGGAGRFRDSGMAPGTGHPRSFWRADEDPAVFGAAVSALAAVIREVRPQVVVTYDDNGDYGHPDHVMAHRVAMAAVDAARHGAARTPRWAVAKVYWTATPRSVLCADAEAVRAAGRGDHAAGAGFTAADPADLPYGVDDDLITTTVDGSAHLAAKTAALRAHATQVLIDEPFYALSNRIGRRISGVEHFRLVTGDRGAVDADGRETDLFAGVAE